MKYQRAICQKILKIETSSKTPPSCAATPLTTCCVSVSKEVPVAVWMNNVGRCLDEQRWLLWMNE
jgi:hypothetical protein